MLSDARDSKIIKEKADPITYSNVGTFSLSVWYCKLQFDLLTLRYLPHGTAVVSPLDGTDYSGSISWVLVCIQEVQYCLSIQVHSVIQISCLCSDLRYRKQTVVQRPSGTRSKTVAPV
jgi:hypothetical protein